VVDRLLCSEVVTLFVCLALSACDGEALDNSVTCAPPVGDDRWFVDRTDESGIAFTHQRLSEACVDTDSVDGPGVCAFDADGDLDSDLFFPNRAGADSAFYRNDDGTFVDVTAEVGLRRPGDAIGCLAFDYDGDGALDLYVSSVGPDALFHNEGGRFVDVTAELGIAESGYSTSATAGDVDGDGDLDLFVARLADLSSCEDACTVLPINCPRMETNLLFINDRGRFSEQAEARGLVERDPSLVSLFFDLDRDGDLDLYVGNDKGYDHPDRMYLNDGSGHFVDDAAALGLDAPGTDTMGVDVGDVDQDGHSDLIATDYSGRPTRLFFGAQAPGGSLSEPLPEESAAFVNWAVGLVDLDLDGDLDVFQTSGTVADLDGGGSLNQLFLNDGGKLLFVEPAPGSALNDRAIYRGAAFLDYDSDGDLDVVVTVNGGRARLLENVGARGNHVSVSLDSLAAGSLVTAQVGTARLTEHALIGGGYLGSSDHRLIFGLGAACSAEVTVKRLDGSVDRHTLRASEELRLGTDE